MNYACSFHLFVVVLTYVLVGNCEYISKTQKVVPLALAQSYGQPGTCEGTLKDRDSIYLHQTTTDTAKREIIYFVNP